MKKVLLFLILFCFFGIVSYAAQTGGIQRSSADGRYVNITGDTMTGNLTMGANSILMTGSLSSTGARVTKGWFTDLESTNMPSVNGTSIQSSFFDVSGDTVTGVATFAGIANFNNTVNLNAQVNVGDTVSDNLAVTGSATFSSTARFNGNVGIGQAPGNDLLDVTGNVFITGTTTNSGVVNIRNVLQMGSSAVTGTIETIASANLDLRPNGTGKILLSTSSEATDLSATIARIGVLTGPQDGLSAMIMDQAITTTSVAMTQVGYRFGMDSVPVLGIRARSNGAGTVFSTSESVAFMEGFVQDPNADTVYNTAEAIIPFKSYMRIAGNGAYVLSSTPTLADGSFDGQRILLQGTSDTNTLTVSDEAHLANSGLALDGGADFTFGQGDILELIYDSGDDKWYEIGRANN